VAGVADLAVSTVIDRWERNGGSIELLENERGEIYHRACAHGYCRYCEDRWQADLYLDQLLAR
jgi:hypothetical protein